MQALSNEHGDLRDPALLKIAEKVEAGERLDRADGLALLASDDLLGVGRLGNAAKERRSGPYAFFVLNRQINPTNICVLSCKFCDYATKAGDDDAYEMTLEEIVEKVRGPIDEVHETEQGTKELVPPSEPSLRLFFQRALDCPPHRLRHGSGPVRSLAQDSTAGTRRRHVER